MTQKNNRVLFATKNPGKLFEFQKAFKKLRGDYVVISYNELPYEIPDCEETGTTFYENARLKVQNARHYLKGGDKNMIVVADDSGMEIDYLNGEPSVFTRRWNGSEMTDDEIIDYCLDKMKGADDRSATYVTCFVVSIPRHKDGIIFGKNKGVILEKPRESSKLGGMPFRSLLFVPELNMMFHETHDLKPSERDGYLVGHEEAIREVVDYIHKKAA